jgi:protein gp37
MSAATKIEWTRSDDGSAGATWNPVTGCVKVSEGCDNCYAETFAERWRGIAGHPFEQGLRCPPVARAAGATAAPEEADPVFREQHVRRFHARVPLGSSATCSR